MPRVTIDLAAKEPTRFASQFLAKAFGIRRSLAPIYWQSRTKNVLSARHEDFQDLTHLWQDLDY